MLLHPSPAIQSGQESQAFHTAGLRRLLKVGSQAHGPFPDFSGLISHQPCCCVPLTSMNHDDPSHLPFFHDQTHQDQSIGFWIKELVLWTQIKSKINFIYRAPIRIKRTERLRLCTCPVSSCGAWVLPVFNRYTATVSDMVFAYVHTCDCQE